MAQDRPLNLVGTYLGMINQGGIPQGGVPRDYMSYASQNPFMSAIQGIGGGQIGQGFSNYFNPFQFGI